MTENVLVIYFNLTEISVNPKHNTVQYIIQNTDKTPLRKKKKQYGIFFHIYTVHCAVVLQTFEFFSFLYTVYSVQFNYTEQS